MLRLPIFFYRFLRKQQAHDSLGPWVTCRTASLLFNSKHLRARLSDSGEYCLCPLSVFVSTLVGVYAHSASVRSVYSWCFCPFYFTPAELFSSRIARHGDNRLVFFFGYRFLAICPQLYILSRSKISDGRKDGRKFMILIKSRVLDVLVFYPAPKKRGQTDRQTDGRTEKRSQVGT